MSAEVVTLRPEGVPRRPMVRWLGSKWRMVPWILQHLPPHELYVEPYGGSASVLLRKPRSTIEVLGDMDDELLTLYAVLRDPDMSARLRVACELTLFSDAEFRLAMRRLPLDADPVERARRMVVRHAMQVSPDVRAETAGTGFWRYTGPDRSVSAMDWSAYPDAIPEIHARLRGVVIERSPAVETIRRHDRVGALHYVDPPYVHATRQDGRKVYSHDMDDSEHRELLDCLIGLKGMAVVSGYASPLYDEALAGWRRGTREVTDHARQWRTEVLWISPTAAKAEATSLMMTGPRHPPRAPVVIPGQTAFAL
ncbi:DNA adenine methylase [Methylorubrum extorquens]|uniref:DNA adenine methylase n=1 Tax=Methylorubrum extorquens TaxID=408 RepID=UPI0022387DB0|nr:DNA adenine methylase [Methylorubrum extorquens]UYW28295.1 DNA adenine methylase [Methylorubrum extorquens]